MNNDLAMSSKWREVKQVIQGTWSKFSKNDIDSLEHDLDGLVEKIVEVYGCAASRAEREYHEFRLALRPLLRPAVVKS